MSDMTGVIKTSAGVVELVGEVDQCKRWLNRQGFEDNGAWQPELGREYVKGNEFLYLSFTYNF